VSGPSLRLIHVNVPVVDPRASAAFYERLLFPDAVTEWLGDSLHLRAGGLDLSFQNGEPMPAETWHFGFLAPSSDAVDEARGSVVGAGIALTDDSSEAGFRSIRFRDPDGCECEVDWEAAGPG
jgi:catechol 2,3-dioxygenase-like lactoylglutathione lyase family enzyme